MGRSLLEKHNISNTRRRHKSELKVVSGGRDGNNSDKLTDTDWYYINGFWNSSLFNQHYMQDDFQRTKSFLLNKYESEFQAFLQKFLNLCDIKREERFQTFNEDQLLHSWIMPVMECLGWWSRLEDESIPELAYTIEDKRGKRTYRPDVAFLPSSKLKAAIQEKPASQRLELSRRYVILTLEAKYWDRIRKTEKENTELGTKSDFSKTRNLDSASSLSPGGQILTYLKHLRNDDPVRNHFGIVTDGKIWRLHHVEHTDKQYFEFDLGELFFDIVSAPKITDLTAKQYQCIEEAARYFFYIFSKNSLFSQTGEPTLTDELLAHRKKYVSEAEPNLKERFLNVMKIACNGFDRAFREKGIKSSPEKVRDVAESYIFNVLFLKSCEAKGIIRYEANTKISITSIIERIAYFDSRPGVDDQTNETINLAPKFAEFSYSNTGIDLHTKIVNLTETVQKGGTLGGREITAFKETLFSDEELALVKNNPLQNIETVKLLYELGYLEENGKFRQVPYNIFTPEQLGSIYESFLEFTIVRADTDLEFLNKQWKPVSKTTLDKFKRRENLKHPTVKKNELFFSPNNKKKKMTGSYYTPDYVVKYMVENTIGPVCKDKTSKEILSTSVCDVAMGSGHFLTEALRFLTKEYLERLAEEDSTIYLTPSQAKRTILDSCIYGADVNPRAVRLGKMALWLETAYSGKKLERLSDQIKCFNSLKADWSKQFPKVSQQGGFSVIIGNPPYLGEKGNKNVFRDLRENSDFCAKQYKRKMDLFYFFFALGIDILKPNGVLSYITTNYWVTADGAETLKQHFIENGAIYRYIDFLDAVIFEGAKGQCNSITFFKKGAPWNNTEIEVLKATTVLQANPKLLKTDDDQNNTLFQKKRNILKDVCPSSAGWRLAERTQSNNNPITVNRSRLKVLGKQSVCRSVETGCDMVTDNLIETALEKQLIHLSSKAMKDYRGRTVSFKKGDGIFVLSDQEVKASQVEEKYLVKFFKNSQIGYYFIDNENPRNLIYVDSSSHLEKTGKTYKHLDSFRPLLAAREQAKNDEHNWYWIRGSKREKIYDKITIVCPYRSLVPKFALSFGEVYGAGDIYHIIDFKGLPPEVMLCYLNSTFVSRWLGRFGKPKGKMFELYQTPLSEIPSPTFLSSVSMRIQKVYQQVLNELNKCAERVETKTELKLLLDDFALARMTSRRIDSRLLRLEGLLKKIDEEIERVLPKELQPLMREEKLKKAS